MIRVAIVLPAFNEEKQFLLPLKIFTLICPMPKYGLSTIDRWIQLNLLHGKLLSA